MRHALTLAVLAALPTLAAAQDSTNLAPITIRSEQDALTTNYTVPASSTATGLDISLKNTPQSVSVITEKQLDEQQANSVTQALNQTPGVYHQGWGNPASGYNIYYVRGYSLDNYRIDGANVQGLSGTQALNNTDSAIYESLTLVRGATGLTSGTGDPGGVVELTRKKPTRERRLSAEIGAGSWKHYRSIIDGSGALNGDASLRGRAIAVYDDDGEWQHRAKQHRGTLYGILEYDLAPKTTLTFGLQHNQSYSTGSSMHGFDTYYGNDAAGYRLTPFGPRDNAAAKWNYIRSRRSELFTRLDHELANGWQIDARYSYTFSKREQRYGVAGTFDIQPNGAARLNSGHWEYTPKEHLADISLSGKYPLLDREQTFKIGVNFNHYDDYHNPLSRRVQQPVANIFTYHGEGTIPATPTVGYGGNKNRMASLYGSTGIDLTDRWHILAGASLTHWKSDERNIYTAFKNQSQKENAIFTPYLGVGYDITDNLTTYAGYSTIFKPQSNKDINHKNLKPEEGRNYEIGLKGEWLDGRLNASAALYESRKNNVAVKAGTYPDDPDTSYYRAENGSKNRGWELTLGGEILPDWRLSASYTRNKSKSRSGETLNTDIPVHQIKLYTAWDIDKHWTVGGSLDWQSKSWQKPTVDNEITRRAYTNDAYTTVDLMARYHMNDNLHIGLNAGNLFNEKRRTAVGWHSYSAPRHVMATLRYDIQ